MNTNVEALKEECLWLEDIFKKRLKNDQADISEFSPPSLSASPYANFINEHKLSFKERLLLILTLCNHLNFEILLKLSNASVRMGDVSQVYKSSSNKLLEARLANKQFIDQSIFIPTGLTFVYLYAGSNWEKRQEAQRFFLEDNTLAQKSVVILEPNQLGHPSLSGKLIMPEQWVEILIHGISAVNHSSIKYGVLESQEFVNEQI